MVISLFFGLLILICTTLVGSTLISRLPKTNIFITLSALNLLGMAILVWAASLAEISGKSFLAPLRYTLGVCLVILFAKGFKERKRYFSYELLEKRYFPHTIKLIFSVALGFVVTVLHNPTFLTSRMSFRVGPDLAGWTIGTKYFCENSSREKLIETVNQQLNIADVALAFRSPLLFPDTYIARMPSFSDQAAAEFLIGAGRIGLPKFLAVYCEVLPTRLNNIMVGGIVWAVIVTSLLILGILEERGLSKKLVFGVTIVSILNINTVSVLMEGGYGQFVSTPFFIAAIYFLQSKHSRELALPFVWIFLLFSINAYQDAIIIFLVIFTFFVAVNFFPKYSDTMQAYRPNKKFLQILFLFLVCNLHQMPAVKKIFLERINSNGVVGGWDQGKVAFPVNLLGVFNWLPYTQTNHTWGFGFLVVVVVISVTLVSILLIALRNAKLYLVMALFFAFLILNFMVYRGGLETNNYQIWKFMAYATPLIWLSILTEDYSGFKIKTQELIRRAIFAVLAVAMISTATWNADWIRFRTFTFETKEAFSSRVLDKYDVVIVGKTSGNATSLILEGDVRFFASSRAFGLPTIRSFPKRDFAYLMERGQCEKISCLIRFINEKGYVAPENFQIIYQDEDLIVFTEDKVSTS